MQFCPTYYDAIAMQKQLLLQVMQPVKPTDKAQCARAWLELEWFKREVRGKPRLKATDATLLLKNAMAKARPALTEPVELEPSPVESEPSKVSAFPQTVPAPPTPEPPSASG